MTEDIKPTRKSTSGAPTGRRKAGRPNVYVLPRSGRQTRQPSSDHSTLGKKTKSNASLSEKWELQDEDDDPMATFLPFCAYCENQILVPHSTVLFCSAKCQRLDSEKSITPLHTPSTSYSNTYTYASPFSPSTPPSGYDCLPTRNYLAPLTPTQPTSTWASTPSSASTSIGITTPPPTPPPSPNTFPLPTRSSSTSLYSHSRSISATTPASLLGTSSAHGRPLVLRHTSFGRSPRSEDLVAPISLGPSGFTRSGRPIESVGMF